MNRSQSDTSGRVQLMLLSAADTASALLRESIYNTFERAVDMSTCYMLEPGTQQPVSLIIHLNKIFKKLSMNRTTLWQNVHIRESSIITIHHFIALRIADCYTAPDVTGIPHKCPIGDLIFSHQNGHGHRRLIESTPAMLRRCRTNKNMAGRKAEWAGPVAMATVAHRVSLVPPASEHCIGSSTI